MRTHSLLALATMGTIAFSATAFGQVPSAGPGHCVAGCGGGSSGGSSGGSRGGGFGGGAAIGSAIGLGMAIGSAVIQQQQQQKSEEQRARQGARKQPTKEAGEGRKAAADKSRARNERSKTEEARRPPEKPTKPDKPTEVAKQPSPDTKQAKLTEQPSRSTRWTGCTGRVGTTWDAGPCGKPTFPTPTPGSSSSASASAKLPNFGQIPLSVSKLDLQLIEKLTCSPGFQQSETTYGGSKCTPVTTAADASKAPVTKQDTSSEKPQPIDGAGLTVAFPAPDYPWAGDPTESKLSECIAAVRPTGPSNASPKCAAAHKKLYSNLQDALKVKAANPDAVLRDYVENQWSDFTKEIEQEMTNSTSGANYCWVGSWLDRDVGHCLNRSFSRYEQSKIQ